jgi:hypothetical protein
LCCSEIQHRPQSKGQGQCCKGLLNNCIQKITEMLTMIAEIISHQPHNQQL